MTPTREERLRRMAALLSHEQMEKLQAAHVMVFGLGGVGGYAAEALARAGVGRLTLVDGDTVAASNLNRQLAALSSTVGASKAEVTRLRLQDAAPDALIEAVPAFYLPDNPLPIPAACDAVLDAVDMVTAKLHLATTCRRLQVPLISCMGMGNRMDPTKIRIGDIFETSGCPLCRVMRRELRRLGVPELRCVYSVEEAAKPRPQAGTEKKGGHPAPGSLSFVPSVAGLYMAYEAVRQICGLP